MVAALLAVTWNGQILSAEWCTVDRSVPVWLQGISWWSILFIDNYIHKNLKYTKFSLTSNSILYIDCQYTAEDSAAWEAQRVYFGCQWKFCTILMVYTLFMHHIQFCISIGSYKYVKWHSLSFPVLKAINHWMVNRTIPFSFQQQYNKLEPYQNSRCHNSDMKQVQFSEPTNIRCHCKEVNHPDNLALRIFAPPAYRVLSGWCWIAYGHESKGA